MLVSNEVALFVKNKAKPAPVSLLLLSTVKNVTSTMLNPRGNFKRMRMSQFHIQIRNGTWATGTNAGAAAEATR